jgi:hypothetical protein
VITAGASFDLKNDENIDDFFSSDEEETAVEDVEEGISVPGDVDEAVEGDTKSFSFLISLSAKRTPTTTVATTNVQPAANRPNRYDHSLAL